VTLLYLEHTPVETYNVAGHPVFVKRDDLFARPPAPPVAKLRGIRAILRRVHAQGSSCIGCFEASQSRIGHALAAACTAFPGLKCLVAYPAVRNRAVPSSALAAERLGARLIPIPSNIVAICYRKAAKLIEAQGAWMLPFGFECAEAVEAVEAEAARLPREFVEGGTVVVPCGSGVTLAGVMRGLEGQPAYVIGVSVGRSVKAIKACLERNAVSGSNIDIRAPMRTYRESASTPCPFPCDARYDLKGWEVLVAEIEYLRPPILFWNVGG
jgi:1-aminocyclopropane-1-carboxylate deaminase/D-cysteine desulfhydrase-like pyridoxal-dependent ACC family enzyme